MKAKEKYELCLKLTSKALDELKMKKRTDLSEEFLKFAEDYFEDAKHFAGNKEYANALESIAYAHGFIDAGVMAGYFKLPDYHLKEI